MEYLVNKLSTIFIGLLQHFGPKIGLSEDKRKELEKETFLVQCTPLC